MDEREFDDFYAASYARLVGQVHAMIGSRDEAEECVQEAFVRAWAHRRRLDRADHPEAWVRTTAHRLAVSRWRRTVLGRRPADRAVSAPVAAPRPARRG
ncbi:MAG: SigE family RNA polymerase sigma factor, partial [Nocardioides sp.]|nr:SigE family RNA polymerase sigma factor [Nocardioides sp.]